ncbi:MAG: DnaA regulatory inactivator Hda [Pseudomonadota bacterium]
MTIERGRQLPLPVQLDVEARFDTFFAGSNASVVAAIKAPPAPGIWLSGRVGSGRSHLLQALVAERSPGSAMYLPLERAFPVSVLDDLPPDMVVCLDNIEQVLGDAAWERALMVLYERVLIGSGRLVIAAADAVRQTAVVLPDLRSRFQALVGLRLEFLDDQAQGEALRLRARFRGLELPEETLRYLMSRLPRDPASLYAWLARLDEASLSEQRKLTVPFVSEVMRRESDA